MYEPLKVVSWASVKGHCPIRHSVNSDEEMTFIFGGGSEEFEFSFDARALHNLLAAGVEAATEMKAYVDLDDEPNSSAA